MDKPFINLNRMKIYAFFDWVYLLKTFRNTHKKYDILFVEKGECLLRGARFNSSSETGVHAILC